MNKIKERVIFVIANYQFIDANQFSNELESSESFKTLNSDLKKIPVQSNIPLPENFPMPLAVYRNDNIQIMYSVGDSRLEISAFNYLEHKPRLENLLKTLAQFKLQEISAIGINFHADCETDKRLSIFNENLSDSTFKNWSKNTGFVVTIPLNLEDIFNCVATYSIKKVSGETDSQKNVIEPYIYNISVNYNFNINEDKADIMKRFGKLEFILKTIKNLYEDFENKCKEITQL